MWRNPVMAKQEIQRTKTSVQTNKCVKGGAAHRTMCSNRKSFVAKKVQRTVISTFALPS